MKAAAKRRNVAASGVAANIEISRNQRSIMAAWQ